MEKEQTFKWVSAGERVPEHSKYVYAKDERGCPLVAFYTPGGKEHEFDCDDDEIPDFITNDIEAGRFLLNEGWYEEVENTGYYDQIIYQRKVTEWLEIKDIVQEEIYCHAGRDGDCVYPDCPQIKDNEPLTTGRHCPLDVGNPERYE